MRLGDSDSNSSHGTYVNGKTIPVDGKEDAKTQVSNACEVKTGDIVRFGTTRKTCSSGEVFAVIEGRLTVKITSVVKEKAKDEDTRTKDPEGEIVQPYTPSDGPQLVEKERHQARKSTSPKIPLPKSKARKWSMLQPAETAQKGTLTDSIDTTTSDSQTVSRKGGMDGDQLDSNEWQETVSPEVDADGDQRFYIKWLETKQEFSVYRRQTLKLIVVCLLIAVLYHLVANSLEASVSNGRPCRM
uniref:Uncharacterized protein n=1 Tax=Anopheles atroparvus TaxID=41427 RepID=A0A182IVP2_ANOAO